MQLQHPLGLKCCISATRVLKNQYTHSWKSSVIDPSPLMKDLHGKLENMGMKIINNKHIIT